MTHSHTDTDTHTDLLTYLFLLGILVEPPRTLLAHLNLLMPPHSLSLAILCVCVCVCERERERERERGACVCVWRRGGRRGLVSPITCFT